MSTIPTGPQATRQRLQLLQGSCNFRDIGGYAAADGRQVKWGQVYRSGVLAYVANIDATTLTQLGVRTICDLRRTEERDREPTQWPDTAAAALSWADDYDMPTIRQFAAKQSTTGAGTRLAMAELYRSLPGWMGPRIRGLFECIARGKAPVIVHCSAGKDRTGVAIAVLLSALGVSKADIVADYLLTNEVGNFEQFIHAHRGSRLGLADAHHPLLSLPHDACQALFAADSDYLEAALVQIDTVHGGMDAYLRNVANLDEQIIANVRQTLLTR